MSVVVVVAVSNDSIFGLSIENDAFISLCFRSFQIEISTQKQRHSMPFLYENGVMNGALEQT